MSELTAERQLEGKIGIITGGAAGIGEATARLFAKHGAKLIIADISDEAGKSVAETLSPCATFIRCDVTKEEDVSAAVDLAMQMHGRLDIMFNNAGITDSLRKSVTDYEMQQFRRVMDINVNGSMHGIKHAARAMVPNKKGSIISMASIAGVMGGTATYAYTASKHAIVGLTKNAAAELGKYGIRVNCISPSGLATDLTLKYMGCGSEEEGKGKVEELCNSHGNLKGATLTVDDIAEAALYLVSDKAKYVSGHNLLVDGGITVTPGW